MSNKNIRIFTAVGVVAACAATALVVRAQAPANVSPDVAMFGSRPGPDEDTDCIIPKAAGALRSTSVDADQSGIAVWSTYEDASGTVRVYRLYHPTNTIAMAAAAMGINSGSRLPSGPAGSTCAYLFRTVRQ
jgi:hypothetical protein